MKWIQFLAIMFSLISVNLHRLVRLTQSSQTPIKWWSLFDKRHSQACYSVQLISILFCPTLLFPSPHFDRHFTPRLIPASIALVAHSFCLRRLCGQRTGSCCRLCSATAAICHPCTCRRKREGTKKNVTPVRQSEAAATPQHKPSAAAFEVFQIKLLQEQVNKLQKSTKINKALEDTVMEQHPPSPIGGVIGWFLFFLHSQRTQPDITGQFHSAEVVNRALELNSAWKM